ncbi:arylformamidase [Salipaludibacillus keqinensis]|uniref:Kynurenine formamidase n=1 Tax=Salipaludibacillus keqinensis TaxID=2045207 RepID=A0A323TIE6_9BACI|nr:cyclase family protein [Salipaludibacillus keqinensis]PYZ94559.1 arylformamidase [Salipaludibacillus keqinensis]
MPYIDITKTLKEKMDVWPGDSPYTYQSTMSISKGDTVNVGKIEMSSHTGTHLDAPYHYDQKGMTIDEIPLEGVCGECLVVDARDHPIIKEDDILRLDLKGIKKILFKTTADIHGHKYEDYPVFSEKAATVLGEKGVQLIGTDAPSVDPLTSKTLPAHHAFRKGDVLILEGLALHHVDPGTYELIALPLKIQQGDGSPVRAVLKEM